MQGGAGDVPRCAVRAMIGVGTGWVVRNGPMVWPRRKAMRELSPGWAGWWKITGVYNVLLLRNKTVRVVRLAACPYGGSMTIHLAVPLFLKRFNINKRRSRTTTTKAHESRFA